MSAVESSREIVFDPAVSGGVAPFWLRVVEGGRTQVVELDAHSLPAAVGIADRMGMPPTHWFDAGGHRAEIPSGIVRHEPDAPAEEAGMAGGPGRG